jgi:hypothetical protein
MTATTKTSAKNCPIGIDEVLRTEIHEDPPILINGVLPAGGGMILGGESEVGKSLMRVEWSVLLACGSPLYGFQTENAIKQEQFRTRRIMQGYGIESVHNRIFYARSVRKPSLLADKFLDHAEQQIKECKATVVWWDPLVSFHNKNENDNVAMRNVLDAITYLNRRTGAASIIIHHFGQPSAKKQDEIPLRYRLRGASAIRDWADTILTLRATGKPDNPGPGRVLDFIKIRNGPQRGPLYLERNNFFVHEVVDENRKVPLQLIKEIVRENGRDIQSQNALIKMVRDRADCGRATAFDAIKEAMDLGYVWEKKVDGIQQYGASK